MSFQEAVQPFTFRAAGITPANFESNHTTAHDALKGALIVKRLRICKDLMFTVVVACRTVGAAVD